MSLPQIDIRIDASAWPAEAELRAAVGRAITAAAREAKLAWPQSAELSLLFTDDRKMAEINGEWRAKPFATNILSFPGSDISPGEPANAMIGDLVLAYETVEREAREQEKPFAHHLQHLLVHGFLHLFGYDHQTPEEAEAMEALERSILKNLGIGDPYAYLENDTDHRRGN